MLVIWHQEKILWLLKLDEALMWINKRAEDRKLRGSRYSTKK